MDCHDMKAEGAFSWYKIMDIGQNELRNFYFGKKMSGFVP